MMDLRDRKQLQTSRSLPRQQPSSYISSPSFLRTSRLLDILDAEGVKATFFVIGMQVYNVGMSQVVRRAQESGHFIASHSFTHPYLTQMPLAQVSTKLPRSNQSLACNHTASHSPYPPTHPPGAQRVERCSCSHSQRHLHQHQGAAAPLWRHRRQRGAVHPRHGLPHWYIHSFTPPPLHCSTPTRVSH